MNLDVFTLNLSTYQIYVLIFLLGSLAVASISDLKNMIAQKEFFHFWAIFTVGVLIFDGYTAYRSGEIQNILILKWIAIAGVCVLSYSKTGILFKLSKMDVAAVAAVMSIMNIYSIVLFVPILKVVSVLEGLVLKRGERYPFIPVVFTTVSLIVGFNLFVM